MEGVLEGVGGWWLEVCLRVWGDLQIDACLRLGNCISMFGMELGVG